ncbi:hypothetical protein EXIGLDRAFT_782959 [Exidia glandulosa HHB12029]|uniref:F-box domain-containing protein n=1 Tax=Exidia glandulosa HHB12029 TaxID=1314781 RepID=A0A166NCB4_EXIGL|nr:hypothetical protein EXIGLDRAFT_782959 [Exidia glandulosa HHB12029]
MSSITDLRLFMVELPPKVLWGILQSCPFLTRSRLQPVDGDFSWRPVGELSFPLLKDMGLYGWGDALFSSWSGFLKLPSLEVLRLDRVHRDYSASAIAGFAATVTTLMLLPEFALSLGADDLDCLVNLTNLTAVEFEMLNGSQISPDFFSQWCRQQAWPHVVTITFKPGAVLSDEAAEALLDLVRTRRHAASDPNTEICQIKSVTFEKSEESGLIPFWLLDQLAALV